jgi:hypothetical protein
LVVALALLLLCGWRLRWLWRLATHVRRFRTTSQGRLVLHHAPEAAARWDVSALLGQGRAELDRLTQRFGAPLRGRVTIFLLASHRDVGKIFGPRYGAAALCFANAIVIAEDGVVQEMMRHEFAHLFSGRWSLAAPPLLSEGLSVWLQEGEQSRRIDAAARPLLDDRGPRLPRLVKPWFFFSEPHRQACYVLAGSFTGFLIRRYGWQPYRRLFRLCDGLRFRAKFERCFGVTLEKAEWQWRNQVVVTEILNRRLGRGVSS